jgi:hypothetical protein
MMNSKVVNDSDDSGNGDIAAGAADCGIVNYVVTTLKSSVNTTEALHSQMGETLSNPTKHCIVTESASSVG